MLIRAYGLFWRDEEIEWFPGGGNKDRYMLLGRQGKRSPKLRLGDFRRQSGLYILYGNYGPYYVGLAREGSLGGRLKRHHRDRHAGMWDRFSWFGFRAVLDGRDERGLQQLRSLRTRTGGKLHQHIGEMEALLIRALGLENNYAQMRFPGAQEWKQVRQQEIDDYLARAVPGRTRSRRSRRPARGR